jgi:hypothetical protein
MDSSNLSPELAAGAHNAFDLIFEAGSLGS